MDLTKILEDLNNYKATNREEILANYIQQRLKASLSVYYKELDKTISYLNAKNELKLLRQLNNSKK